MKNAFRNSEMHKMNYNLLLLLLFEYQPNNILIEVTTYITTYINPHNYCNSTQWPTMLLRGSPCVFWTWLLVFAAVAQADEANGPNPATLDASRRQSASSAIVLDQQEIDCLHTQALSTRAKWVLLQVQKCARRQS